MDSHLPDLTTLVPPLNGTSGSLLTLREAIEVAVRADPPMRSASALARQVGVSREWLVRLWHRVFQSDEAPSLKGFLISVQILRSLQRHADGASWGDITEELRISPRSMRRMTRKVIGKTPTEITPEVSTTLYQDRLKGIAGSLARALRVEPRESGARGQNDRPRWSGLFLLLLAIMGLASCGSRVQGFEKPELGLSVDLITAIGGGASPDTVPPVLEMPTYVRIDADRAIVWVLDTGRRTVSAFGYDGGRLLEIGGRGRGPGEFWVPVSMDLDPTGVAWIADVGNGKVLGVSPDGSYREFLTSTIPLSVAAVGKGEIWLAGDLVTSLFAKYSTDGEYLGTFGTPADTRPVAFRVNQGVAVSGSGDCRALWAYAYRSILECFEGPGNLAWRAEGPVPIAPPEDYHPRRMSADEEFAYTDVAVAGDRMYALFVGRRPSRLHGLATNVLHVFDASSGAYVGRQTLPERANYVARSDSLLALTVLQPTPSVRLYRVVEES